MPKQAKELGALAVGKITATGMNPVGGVPGLYLLVDPGGSRSWVLRASVGGKRREMGLGGYPGVTVAQARETAREIRKAVASGGDPLADKRASKRALAVAAAARVTFEQAAGEFIKGREAEWKNAKHGAQWRTTLKEYAFPIIGRLDVADVGLSQVVSCLGPIWTTKTETASRLRGRIESILSWATVRGYRSGINPAQWRGNLDTILAKPSKVAEEEHHPALPVGRIGAFMVELRKCSGPGARCLEFAILTAARSQEARRALWSEIDLAAGHWTIPGDRMKKGREHRVPLSPAVLEILRDLPRFDTDLVFPSARGGALSDATLGAIFKRLHASSVKAGGIGWKDPKLDRIATAHGTARSTFRDWIGERTNYQLEVAEQALSHSKDAVVGAYWRGTAYEKRIQMMADWAVFCDKPMGEAGDNVVPLLRTA